MPHPLTATMLLNPTHLTAMAGPSHARYTRDHHHHRISQALPPRDHEATDTAPHPQVRLSGGGYEEGPKARAVWAWPDGVGSLA